MRICKNGRWHDVTVDDYFPCTAEGGPVFTRAKNGELWVMLLEKAYAKLHGNYSLLREGLAFEALLDLTGAPTEAINLEDPNIVELIKSGTLFDSIVKANNQGFLLTA